MIHHIRIDHLQEIKFLHKSIVHIEDMAFAGISNLCWLSLIHTGLMSMPPLTPVKNSLARLVLHSNNISRVPHDYFLHFKKLYLLDLSSNILHQVPDITPLHNIITFLRINENNIMSISGWLNATTYHQLRYISMDKNVIRMFDPYMMSFWPGVTSLSLINNHIIHLPTSYPEQNCSLRRVRACNLYFDGNPIHCDKAVESIITRRLERNPFVDWNCYITIEHLKDIVCASPAYLCGLNLGDLGMWIWHVI